MVGTLLLSNILPAALYYVGRKSAYPSVTLHEVLSEALVYQVRQAIHLQGWHPTATGWHPTSTGWHLLLRTGTLLLQGGTLLLLPYRLASYCHYMKNPTPLVWQNTRPTKHANGNIHYPEAQVVA